MVNKYSGINSYEQFCEGIKNGEIHQDNHLFYFDNKNGKLAERIVSRRLAKKHIPCIDKIKNFFLTIFSNDYRKAKIDFSIDLSAYKIRYLNHKEQKSDELEAEPVIDHPLLPDPQPTPNNPLQFSDNVSVEPLEQDSVETNTQSTESPEDIEKEIEQQNEIYPEAEISKKKLVAEMLEMTSTMNELERQITKQKQMLPQLDVTDKNAMNESIELLIAEKNQIKKAFESKKQLVEQMSV